MSAAVPLRHNGCACSRGPSIAGSNGTAALPLAPNCRHHLCAGRCSGDPPGGCPPGATEHTLWHSRCIRGMC